MEKFIAYEIYTKNGTLIDVLVGFEALAFIPQYKRRGMTVKKIQTSNATLSKLLVELI